MKAINGYVFALLITISVSSCVSNKKFESMQDQLNAEIEMKEQKLDECKLEVVQCQDEKTQLKSKLSGLENTLTHRQEQIDDLRKQVKDAQERLDKQMSQVGDLTVLSTSANENIKETLAQLEQKDKYIRLLQTAKNKTDSINLALAVNLKGALRDGIEDEDVEIKVDKTVVFINLSDKMLYQSGSANLTTRAREVLGKIATIVEDRPDLEIMVEGYTDNVPISNQCIQDNWDLSVKRATSVVRVLQNEYKINPNKLIAAGRGEYNTLASNATAEGRSKNRRTRIIILPKLNQFYDLLNPATASK